LGQSLIFNLLREKLRDSSATIHYWRTKDGARVDFVVNYGREQIPMEVKCRRIKQFRESELTKSFKRFVDKYQPQKALVVNLNLDLVVQRGKTQIKFFPFYKVSL